MNNVVLLAKRICSLQNHHMERTSEYTEQYTALTEKLSAARLEVKPLTEEAVQMKESYERNSSTVQNQIIKSVGVARQWNTHKFYNRTQNVEQLLNEIS